MQRCFHHLSIVHSSQAADVVRRAFIRLPAILYIVSSLPEERPVSAPPDVI